VSNNIGLPIKSDFIIENDSYVKTKVVEGRAFGVEVGDEKQPGRFWPQLKTKVFDNESNFSIRYLGFSEGEKPKIEGDKIVWEDEKAIVEFSDSDEGFKFSLILKEKPSRNDIRFSITHKNLIFYKQGEVTKKLADDLGVSLKEAKAGRPENVVNSYAVYHSQKANNEYRTGKAFHLFRPKAIDSAGVEGWCDIDITGTVFSIELPNNIFNSVNYPVKID